MANVFRIFLNMNMCLFFPLDLATHISIVQLIHVFFSLSFHFPMINFIDFFEITEASNTTLNTKQCIPMF